MTEAELIAVPRMINPVGECREWNQLNSVAGLFDLLRFCGRIGVAVEVGSHRGVSTEAICLHAGEVWSIDPSHAVRYWSEVVPRRRNLKTLRTTSDEAARAFPDESIDFVYIDALHDYASVAANINEWWPKVRQGGWIAGHDFITIPGKEAGFGVIAAVRDSLGEPDAVFSDFSWVKRKNAPTRFQSWGRGEARFSRLPGEALYVQFTDSLGDAEPVKDAANIASLLSVEANDVDAPGEGVACPSMDDARRILAFWRGGKADHLVAQCDAGAGRSQAVVAALQRLAGQDNSEILRRGSYNRTLYRGILAAAGRPEQAEPLVSVVVRVKYPSDRLAALLLSLSRQRHTNWEAIVVKDGPSDLPSISDPRVRILQTSERKGRWGHPWRQAGIDACRGDYIVLQNDDNYLTPGYLEQMVAACERADIAVCGMSQSNNGWGFVMPEPRLWSIGIGCWIARSDVARSVPFEGDGYTADGEYFERIAAGRKVVMVNKPLFVAN